MRMEPKLKDKEEAALLLVTACASPPKDRACWTLKLLAGVIVKPAGPQTGEPENRRTLAHRDQEGRAGFCLQSEVEQDLLRLISVRRGGALLLHHSSKSNSSMLSMLLLYRPFFATHLKASPPYVSLFNVINITH